MDYLRISSLMSEGDKAFKVGKFEEALNNYNKAKNMLSNIYNDDEYEKEQYVNILYNIGVSLLKLKRRFEAIDSFKKAIAISLEDKENLYSYIANSYYNIAYCYGLENKNLLAYVYINRASAYNPKDEMCTVFNEEILKRFRV